MSIFFSSKSIDWETPAWVFKELDEIHNFTLDVCAHKENAKCERFFSPEDDGLRQSWAGHTCWMNPPYGKAIKAWIEKAVRESKDAKIVCLLPARTDTGWFQDFVLPNKKQLHFIRGRLKFGDSINSAPFASMVVVFDARQESAAAGSDRNGLETKGGSGS